MCKYWTVKLRFYGPTMPTRIVTKETEEDIRNRYSYSFEINLGFSLKLKVSRTKLILRR